MLACIRIYAIDCDVAGCDRGRMAHIRHFVKIGECFWKEQNKAKGVEQNDGRENANLPREPECGCRRRLQRGMHTHGRAFQGYH